MIHFDDVTGEGKTKHNPNCPYIPDHPDRIFITGSSGSRKINALLNLIIHQLDIDKMDLDAKDPYEKDINC